MVREVLVRPTREKLARLQTGREGSRREVHAPAVLHDLVSWRTRNSCFKNACARRVAGGCGLPNSWAASAPCSSRSFSSAARQSPPRHRPESAACRKRQRKPRQPRSPVFVLGQCPEVFLAAAAAPSALAALRLATSANLPISIYST